MCVCHADPAHVLRRVRAQYTRECAKLISQFKTLETALRAEGAIGDTEGFMREYSMYAACAARARAARGAPHRSCSRASERLLRAGVPATVIHRSFDDRGVAVSVAEAVSCFITAMDGLKLNLRAVDEIQPLLSDLMARCGVPARTCGGGGAGGGGGGGGGTTSPTSCRPRSLGKIHSLEADAACKTKVAEWLVALNGMRASASVGEEQVRQMLFDLDQAYSAFTASLGRK